jgi:peptide deformylase
MSTTNNSPLRISDVLIQKGEEYDDYLYRQLFNVNIRLFNSNRNYKDIIVKVCEYMENILKQDYSDYGKLAGLSGANIGIPFNIVLVIVSNKVNVLINPIITKVSKKTKSLQSNCGSLNLPAKIPVKRREWIDVSFYGIDGNHYNERFQADAGGSTIQHEIDHNRGILITDTEKHI